MMNHTKRRRFSGYEVVDGQIKFVERDVKPEEVVEVEPKPEEATHNGGGEDEPKKKTLRKKASKE